MLQRFVIFLDFVRSGHRELVRGTISSHHYNSTVHYHELSCFYSYRITFVFRVLRKMCPFRPCCGSFAFPEIAGSHRELCTALVERLEKEGPVAVMKSLGEETRAAIKGQISGFNRDDAIRARVQGSDDLSKV